MISHTGSEKTNVISALHLKLLIDIASQLGVHIISIGSNGALVEFQAQTAIQKFSILNWLSVCHKEHEIDFNCPIFPNVVPVICVQDSNHEKKQPEMFVCLVQDCWVLKIQQCIMDNYLLYVNNQKVFYINRI